jgi:diadenosine tetraphosphate (Ap4A) HIT family hydrolase/5-methylcytosine-specific restriction endonuclease McrA
MTSHSAAFTTLSDFIGKRMRMSHVYQPVMLMEIIKRGGSASVTEIAKSLLERDPSQVEYYEQITKNMVGDVLTEKNGVTEKIKDGRSVVGYRLPHFDSLSAEERDELVSMCTEKIHEYVEKRGDQIWSHRRKSAGYIPGTLRYEVLKRAKRRCELCGISADEKALEVDHIIPRNMRGSDDLSNLQALCYSCNAMKRDRDDTDFRKIAASYDKRDEGCLFCEIDGARVIAENELCYAIRDDYRVTEHHTLIIPKRHVSGFFDLYQPEINAIYALLADSKREIEKLDNQVSGFNVGVNAGADAGQTIFHCHIHLIPRRKGDVENPRGGVRAVILEKRIY